MRKGPALILVAIAVFLILAASGYFLYTKGYFVRSLVPSEVTSEVLKGVPSDRPLTTEIEMIDEAGNLTSGNITLTITSPLNGATLNSTTVNISGKTSPRADVFVNDKETKADAQGNFSLKIELEEGQNSLVVIANDESGNVVEQVFSVNIQSY
jgi:hypothetical protein